MWTNTGTAGHTWTVSRFRDSRIISGRRRWIWFSSRRSRPVWTARTSPKCFWDACRVKEEEERWSEVLFGVFQSVKVDLPEALNNVNSYYNVMMGSSDSHKHIMYVIVVCLQCAQTEEHGWWNFRQRPAPHSSCVFWSWCVDTCSVIICSAVNPSVHTTPTSARNQVQSHKFNK